MGPYRVVARNTATDSDNKIHDDTVARSFGFAGGLVPGVVVHAYLTHPPVERWGLDWLETGRIASRFVHPVYDGEPLVIEPVDGGSGPDQAVLGARSVTGVIAATATIWPPRSPAIHPPDIDLWPHVALPDPDERLPASEEAFRERPMLGALDAHFHSELASQYLDAIGETLPVYRDGVAHPGWLIAQANFVLSANVRLGPWIHVSSDVTHFAMVRDGDLVSTRARIASTSERKGHRFVELDVVMVNGAERAVLRARHTAIYQPRRSTRTD
jgi:acyl dehydratase